MTYEPEIHLAALERYLGAVHILVSAGFVADPTAYILASDAPDEDGVEFGIPFAKGSDTYWLNVQSVECVHQWEADK